MKRVQCHQERRESAAEQTGTCHEQEREKRVGTQLVDSHVAEWRMN